MAWVDYGGPAMLVQGAGIKMGNFDHLVRRFTEELEQLVTNPDRVAPRSIGTPPRHNPPGMPSSEDGEIYRWITSRREAKPNFWAQPNSSCLTQCEACTEAIPNPNRSSDEYCSSTASTELQSQTKLSQQRWQSQLRILSFFWMRN